MTGIGVVVGTYGDYDVWRPLALRAMKSVENQTVQPDWAIWEHGETLASARNVGASSRHAWNLIFLDADDELDPHYIEHMVEAQGKNHANTILQPSTLGIVDGVEDDEPYLIPRTPLLKSNYAVIGSMCPADIFHYVKGFSEMPVLEDWDLWIRMCLYGGTNIKQVPEAIYRVHVRKDSRNQNHKIHGQTYAHIQKMYREDVKASKNEVFL